MKMAPTEKHTLSRYDLERIACEAIQLHWDSPKACEEWALERMAEKLRVWEVGEEYRSLAQGIEGLVRYFNDVAKELYLPQTTPPNKMPQTPVKHYVTDGEGKWVPANLTSDEKARLDDELEYAAKDVSDEVPNPVLPKRRFKGDTVDKLRSMRYLETI